MQQNSPERHKPGTLHFTVSALTARPPGRLVSTSLKRDGPAKLPQHKYESKLETWLENQAHDIKDFVQSRLSYVIGCDLPCLS